MKVPQVPGFTPFIHKINYNNSRYCQYYKGVELKHTPAQLIRQILFHQASLYVAITKFSYR